MVKAVDRYKSYEEHIENPKRDVDKMINDFRKVINDLNTELISKKNELRCLKREKNLNENLKKTQSTRFRELIKIIQKRDQKEDKSTCKTHVTINSPKRKKSHPNFRIKIKTEPIEILKHSKKFKQSSPKYSKFRNIQERNESNLMLQLSLSCDGSPKNKKIKITRRQETLSKRELEKELLYEQFMTDCLKNKLKLMEEDYNLFRKKIRKLKEYSQIQNMNQELGKQRLNELKVS